MDLPARFILENKAWADEMSERDPNFFDKLIGGQQPDVFWIGCADSRVPAERITNAAPGELFVHRSVANLVIPGDTSLMSALQYAVEELRVPHIIVCGHDGCGGVRAALMPGPEDDGMAPPAANEESNYLAERIRPLRELYRRRRREVDSGPAAGGAIDEIAVRVDRLVTVNVAEQVRSLARTSIVRRAWQRGQKIQLHGWVYGLHDGRLRQVLMLDADSEAVLHAAA